MTFIAVLGLTWMIVPLAVRGVFIFFEDLLDLHCAAVVGAGTCTLSPWHFGKHAAEPAVRKEKR